MLLVHFRKLFKSTSTNVSLFQPFIVDTRMALYPSTLRLISLKSCENIYASRWMLRIGPPRKSALQKTNIQVCKRRLRSLTVAIQILTIRKSSKWKHWQRWKMRSKTPNKRLSPSRLKAQPVSRHSSGRNEAIHRIPRILQHPVETA